MGNLTRAAASRRQKTFSDKNKRRARHRSCNGERRGQAPVWLRIPFDHITRDAQGGGGEAASKTRRFSAKRKRARRENLILVFRHPSVSV